MSISDAYSRNGEVGGEGPWVWCVTEACDEDWDGYGEIYVDTADDELKTAFIDAGDGLKLLGFDQDNRIGNEVNGDPSFIGDGIWAYSAGDSTDVEIYMARISASPASLAEMKEKFRAASFRQKVSRMRQDIHALR